MATLEARKISNSVLEDRGRFLSRREAHQNTKKTEQIETMRTKTGKETGGEEFSLLDCNRTLLEAVSEVEEVVVLEGEEVVPGEEVVVVPEEEVAVVVEEAGDDKCSFQGIFILVLENVTTFENLN